MSLSFCGRGLRLGTYWSEKSRSISMLWDGSSIASSARQDEARRPDLPCYQPVAKVRCIRSRYRLAQDAILLLCCISRRVIADWLSYGIAVFNFLK